MGSLAVGQDTCRVDSSGQVLSNILLKSSVTSGAEITALAFLGPEKTGLGQNVGGVSW